MTQTHAMPDSSAFEPAMHAALEAARCFMGATTPNPPVGAAILDAQGRILALAAHERAGCSHAEAAAIAKLRESGRLLEAHTLVCTLEPCNHTGRTPPCTEAILSTPIRRVVIGAGDPHPIVNGAGVRRLRESGLEVMEGVLEEECRDLIQAYTHRLRTGRPWIIVKTAHLPDGSMIPPTGMKTFTSADSLRTAHELRRSCDAIITGSGTVLADDPQFTVRHVEDHPGKRRWLVILDRRRRVSARWIEEAGLRGFDVIPAPDLEASIEFLAEQGATRVLIEAGPTLLESVFARNLWNEHVLITQGTPDRVRIRRNEGAEAVTGASLAPHLSSGDHLVHRNH